MVFETIATLFAGLFAGASVYINLVEHPARIECGTDLAIKEFAPSYRRATILQVPLAGLGFLMALAAFISGGSFWWLAGGIMLVAVIPFTLLVIFPTNKKLLEPSLDQHSSLTSAALIRWGRLHAVRSVLGLLAFLIFVILLN
jgi:Anthrone oxygenase